MRAVAVALAVVLVAASCDLQVKDRFRSDDTAPTQTTAIEDEASGDPGTTTTTEVGVVRGEPIPADVAALVDDRVSVLGRPVDVVATLRWSQVWTEDLFELEVGAVVRLELILLRVNELERLGLLEEGETPDPTLRWYAVAGTVRHEVAEDGCAPGDRVEACEITFLTDGTVTGIANRRNDVLNVALVWQTVGREGEEAIPSVGVEYRTARGQTVVDERNVLRASLERAGVVGGSGTVVVVDAEPGRRIATIDAEGEFSAVDVN